MTGSAINEIFGTVVTGNERYWIEVIRLASNDCDPPPTLRRTQAQRRL